MENLQNFRYSRNEQIDMLLIYGECRKNATMACQLYAERYPDRIYPSRTTFKKVETRLRNEEVRANDNYIVSEEAEINVLAYVSINPNASVREMETNTNVSRESARRILHKHKYRCFKYTLHQHLYENDFVRRLQYCNWFTTKCREDNRFPYKILFSDESRFTNNGMFNRNNLRCWAKENPHLIREGRFQERFGFNVWIGILGRNIVGPIIFDGPLTGARYLQFLQTEIRNSLEEIPQHEREGMYFHQDGCGPHNAGNVREYLTETFGNNWIGTNGPIRWPPRSPDLTPIDFYLWGKLKNKIYSRQIMDIADLRNRFNQAINEITVNELEAVLRRTRQRAELCIEENGQHFEHLIGH